MARIKHPQHAHMTKEELEAPTRKQNALPADLREPGSKPTVQTGRVPKAKIEAILDEQEKQAKQAKLAALDADKDHESGLRAAISEDDIDRYERDIRRSRETVPAPALEDETKKN